VWLVTRASDVPPVAIAAHTHGCAACGRLVDDYQGALERLAAATTLASALRVPSFAQVRMALPLVEAPPLWRRWLPVVAALALAATLVVWASAARDLPVMLPTAAPAIATSIEEPSNVWRIDPQIATVSSIDGELDLLDWSRASADIAVTHGAARFAVAPHMIGERFVVRTPQATVTAVGTEFGVAFVDGVTTVDVSEGVVLVEAPALGVEVTVAAGSSLTLAPLPAPTTQSEPAPLVEPTVALPEVVKVDVEGTQREARRLLAKGAPRQAVARIERELTHGPSDRLAALLGDARRLAGDARGAAEAYEIASRSHVALVRERALEDLAATRASLGDDVGVAAAWERYLELAPSGHAAPRALAALGRDDELLARFPAATEASAIVIRRARERLVAHDWEGSVALLTPWLASPDASRAEAALVGIMRARLGQGRRADVGTLGDWYRTRFPDGARRAEVERMLAAAGLR